MGKARARFNLLSDVGAFGVMVLLVGLNIKALYLLTHSGHVPLGLAAGQLASGIAWLAIHFGSKRGWKTRAFRSQQALVAETVDRLNDLKELPRGGRPSLKTMKRWARVPGVRTALRQIFESPVLFCTAIETV